MIWWRVPRERARRIDWSDMILAAVIGFIGVPSVIYAFGILLGWTGMTEGFAGNVIDVAGMLAFPAPFAILGSIPGLIVADWLRSIGWIGLLPVIASGAALASIAGLGNFEMIGVFAPFGAFYAGVCWIALRLLRRDVFVVSEENHIRDEVSPFD